MNERRRNDLYYLNRVHGDFVLHPDGSAGLVETAEVARMYTVKGRRGELRREPYMQRQLVETETFEDVAALRIADKKRVAENLAKHAFTNKWAFEDMPDDVQERFHAWEESLARSPDWLQVQTASKDVLLARAAAGEDRENATLTCPDCKGDSQYKCYRCGYARQFYKYPTVRFYDLFEDRQAGTTLPHAHDVLFDAAWYLQVNPEALRYETEMKFDYYGKMAAVRYAVLSLGESNGMYVGNDQDARMIVDEADELAGEIRVPLAVWNENKKGPHIAKPINFDGSLTTVINALQEKCAVDLARETIDSGRQQEAYDEYMRRMKQLGGSALDAVIVTRYMGMGDSEMELMFGTLPMDDRRFGNSLRDDTVAELVEQAVKRIDVKNKRIDVREEGGF